MKYLPTIDLWNNAIQRAVLSGQLRLQAGQWVQCGEGKKSRFVCVKGLTLWVAHWQGTARDSNKRFKTLLEAK